MKRRLAAAISLCLIPISLAYAQKKETVFRGSPVLLMENGAREGPTFHRDHGLFFSGSKGITRVDQKGHSELFLPDSGSNGLLFDRQGRLLICQQKMHRISRMDVATKELTVLADNYQGAKFNTPNDITVDPQGRIYFSDPRYGSREGMEIKDEKGKLVEGVYRIDLDGKTSRVLTHEVDRPNGVLITPDGQFLYVADNHNNTIGAARKLWKFRLSKDGSVDTSSQKLVMDWKTGRGPDGMAIDRLGNLYVAGGLNEPHPPHETADVFKGGIYVFSPDGTLLDFAQIPRDEVTNCTFGGDDLRTLYITAGGTLWAVKTITPGTAMSPNR